MIRSHLSPPNQTHSILMFLLASSGVKPIHPMNVLQIVCFSPVHVSLHSSWVDHLPHPAHLYATIVRHTTVGSRDRPATTVASGVMINRVLEKTSVLSIMCMTVPVDVSREMNRNRGVFGFCRVGTLILIYGSGFVPMYGCRYRCVAHCALQ